MVLGQQQVQGVDYAYTLQGWLKGINSTSVGDGTYDMGEDGKSGSMHSNIARDAFGFSLNYYNGDFTSININPFATISNSLPLGGIDNKATGKDLFNGNIRAMLVNIPKLGDAQLYGYSYDQLNRITAMNTFTGLSSNSFTANGTDNYRERITYDANGNILTYLRNGDAARVSMDEMTYTYKANTNQLDKVVDIAADETTNYAKYNDIKQGQANGNYEYDAIGNLIGDVSENITNIVWNVYGKIQSIEKSSGDVDYSYDASGNRISKTHNGKTTWYVRDASGNVMGIYVKDAALNDNHLTLNEVHLYGSSRLGVLNLNVDMEVVPTSDLPVVTRGNKFFELSNHLGNVLVTISDKRIAVPKPSPNNNEVDYYLADVVTANDYYPFGMQMPERNFDAGSKYRYGFNGKENDNEVKGEGNQQDYGMRIHDTRLGRFLSVDPLTDEYPELTPYQFAGNTPIQATDLDGEEPSYHYEDGKGRLVVMPAGDNLQRRVPQEHLKYLPQGSRGGPGIMDEGTSALLDNIPVVGTIKGAIEGIVGTDAAGNKLSNSERVLGIVPYVGKAKKTLKVLKAADNINDSKKLTKAASKIDDAVSTDKAISKADDGILFSADLSKSKAKTRSGHSNAGNKQLNEAMQNDPALRRKIETLDENAMSRTSTGNGGRRNPKNLEWDHNNQNPNKLDLRTKENHRAKTANDPGRKGGFSLHHKKN